MFRKTLLVAFSLIGLSRGGTFPINKERDESNSNPRPYIFGGMTVEGREFPGLASIHRNGFHFCGGSILNAEWILTTSNCMFDYGVSPYYVLVGTNHLDEGGTEHPVEEVIYHEGYNKSDSWVNDIALLRLKSPIEFGEGLAPVKVPAEGEETPVGTAGAIAGWGQIDYVKPIINDLQKLSMEVYDHEKCREAYARMGKHVYSTQICAAAAEGGNGPGYGDSADPFMVDGKLVGLTSWERRDNAEGYPVVMTKVSDYIGWINEHMKE